tara:strand:- start:179 stop:637 length:459 start_codon:yes stop_codon:yes gene_type:complete
MAHQSSWKLREAREEKEKIRTSFRISLPLLDLTAGKISEIGGDAKRGPEIISRALLRRLHREPERIPIFASSIKELKSPLPEKPSKKMNLSLASGHSKVLEQLKEATSLNQSEILRRALYHLRYRSSIHRRIEKPRGAYRLDEVGVGRESGR